VTALLVVPTALFGVFVYGLVAGDWRHVVVGLYGWLVTVALVGVF